MYNLNELKWFYYNRNALKMKKKSIVSGQEALMMGKV